MRYDDRIGKRGSAEVEWLSGRRTKTAGVVLSIREDRNEVFLESGWGPVVGDLDTLEMDEED